LAKDKNPFFRGKNPKKRKNASNRFSHSSVEKAIMFISFLSLSFCFLPPPMLKKSFLKKMFSLVTSYLGNERETQSKTLFVYSVKLKITLKNKIVYLVVFISCKLNAYACKIIYKLLYQS